MATEEQKRLKAQFDQENQVGVVGGVARAAAQGLTFGGADEAEAYIRSILGTREYDEILEEVRGQVKQFGTERPGLSLGSEIGGAVLPAIIASLFTGGTGGVATMAARYPNLVRLGKATGIVAPETLAGGVGYGALQGAATGFLSAEDTEDRIRGLVSGAGLGGATGLGADLFSRALQGTVGNFMDFARRKFGNKAGSAVEQELQRIAQEAGITPEQAYIQVAEGKLMAENATLREVVRGYFDAGGPGATLLQKAARERPGELRGDLVEEMQQYLTDVAPGGNVLAGQAKKMEDLKKTAQDLYSSPAMQRPISANAMPMFQDIFRRIPEAFTAVKRELGVEGRDMFFEISEDGAVNILRAPTIEEAEIVRRALADLRSKYYKAGEGGTAQAYGRAENELRQTIDMLSDETQQARATYNKMMDQGRAFEAGQKAFKANPDVDQIELDVDKFAALGDDALAAYRTGIWQKMRIAMTGKRSAAIVADLANETSPLGNMLRIIFPGEDIADLANKLQTQEGADAFAKSILSKSPTASSAAQQARQGMDIGVEDVLEAGTTLGLVRIMRKLAGRTRPDLTDKQREEVVQALLSRDPEMIKNMLRDESGAAQLQNLIQRAAEAAYAGGRSGAIYGAAQNPEGVLGMFGGQQ